MATKVATFQQGVGAYSQTVDTLLVPAAATQNNATSPTLIVDKGGEQTLLRFDGLFGGLPSQVPPGATIVSASLTLQTTDAGDGADLHRMNVAWSDTATYSSMGSGVQANGTEAATATAAAISKPTVGLTVIDVTSSIQDWLAGTPNYGWVLLSKGTNGWDFMSSEGSTPPKLTIVYSVPDANTAPTGVDDFAIVSNSSSIDLAVLANDTDANSDALSVTGISTPPVHGVASVNPNGTIHYVPSSGYVGQDSFVYALSDGHGGASSATVHLTVTAANSPPSAQSDAVTTAEDTPVIVAVLVNDSDPNGDTLTVTDVATAPSHGTASINSNGTLTYSPAPNYSGVDALTYSIGDGNGGTSQASVSITVTSVNDPPTAVADTATVQNTSAVNISVLLNDVDVDGDSLTVSALGNPSHGSAVLNPNQTVSYSPSAGYVGNDSFNYSMSDGHGGTATGAVTVSVTAAITGPQTVVFKQGSSGYSGTVDTMLVQASPTQGNATTAVIGVDKTTDIQALLRFDGLFGTSASQIPTGAVITSATLTLQTTNPGNGATVYRMLQPWSDTATWNSLVNGVQANGVEAMSSGGINVPVTKVGVTTIDVTSSLQGWASGLANNGWVFISKGTDGWDFYSAQGTTPPQLSVTYTLPTTNTPPVAVADSATLTEDGSTIISVLANDTDANADNLTVTGIGSPPQHGVAVVNPNGTIGYSPNANFFGNDSLTYIVSDGHGGLATGTVTLTITPVNDAPLAADDSMNTAEDVAVVAAVLGNDTDVDGDVLSLVAISATPAHGTAAINGNGTITYTPTINYNGTDSFSYSISDGHGGTSVATVNISIAPTNDAPNAADDSTSTNENQATTITVLANDSDVDGDTLVVTQINVGPQHGTAAINPNGTITYTPAGFYFGSDSFGYTISDGHGGEATATSTISIGAVNSSPVASDDSAILTEDGSATISVLANDIDPDSDPLTIASIATAPGHGTVLINHNNTLTYIPDPNYWGSDSFIYAVTDGHGGTASASVNLAVTAVNDQPVAASDAYTLNEDSSVALSLLANDVDVDGDNLTISGLSVGPVHGSASINGDGTVTYTPTANYFGDDSFIYSASDGHGGSSTATVSLTVTSVNDAPTATADSFSTGEDTAIALSVLANDLDVDGDSLSIAAITAAPLHGTAVISGTTIVYTPSANFFGSDALTYRVSDGHGGTATASTSISVTSNNDNPVASPDSATTRAATSVTVNVLANDSDVDGDSVSLTGVTNPQHGSVVVNNNNTITYTPNAGFSGTDAFTYGISDGHGGTGTGTVSVSVTSDVLYASYVATKIGSGAPQRVFEHDNATKSFFFDGSWWAVLPDNGNWSIHQYSGSKPTAGTLGGWTVASEILQSNKMRADLVWDPVHEKVFILQSSTSSTPHLYELSFDASKHSWVIDADIKLGGVGGALAANMWINNGEVALGLDQFGNPLVSAIASSSQGTKGLHLAYATSADLSTWSYVTLDTRTTNTGGSNGDSKADIITFTDNGVAKIGVIYSRDGVGTDDDWSIAWRTASSNAANYASGWTTEVATSDVHIDNHLSAVSEGDTMFVAIKDDNNSIWLLKGTPGHWGDPILVVDGNKHEPSRPTLVIDDSHQTLYIFYQESTGSPTGDIYMKTASLADPHFNAASLGQLIIQGTNTNNNYIDPQVPADHVGADTNDYFVLLAKNDSTNEIWYNDIHLDGTLIA